MNKPFQDNLSRSFIILLLLVALGSSLLSALLGGLSNAWLIDWLRQFSLEVIGALLTFMGFEVIAGRRLRAEQERHQQIALIREARLGNFDALQTLKNRNMLAGQDFSKSILDGISLDGVNLQAINLESASLQNAYLEGSDLRYANLERANLSGVNLRNAQLAGARASWASLPNAALTRANLSAAVMVAANLQNASCRWAELTQVVLESADLRNADLHNA
ncbi:MAG: pentapeptide repeat-containing protein, partial [Anaerolineae bacterium]|nr:pentapeptide repeat-containing protein [Anaerolineae bacterium]